MNNNEVMTIETKLEVMIDYLDSSVQKLTELMTEYEDNEGVFTALSRFYRNNSELLEECLEEINRLNGR